MPHGWYVLSVSFLRIPLGGVIAGNTQDAKRNRVVTVYDGSGENGTNPAIGFRDSPFGGSAITDDVLGPE